MTRRLISSMILALTLSACWPAPPTTSCEDHPEPWPGDIPCGFVDGVPVGGDG